jgi:membrane fusion protein, heavy metal efflux system
MMRLSLNIRLGKLLGWGLLALLALAALGGSLTLLPYLRAAHAGNLPSAPEAGSTATQRPTRPGPNSILVPSEVLQSLNIQTAEAVAATRPRSLPPLAGCLALDPNRMVRIHARFAGEVIALGTTAEAYSESGQTESTRPLRYGDRVQKGQLLAVVWSKDLGEKKSELIDVLSRLKLDRAMLERLRGLDRQGATPERTVREAERAVEADLISVARVERTLRSWRLSEAEISSVRAEAERLGTREGTGPDEAWARVEVRAPQAGVILEKNVAVGDLVDTSADLFKVADLSQLTVWAHVYEEDLPVLQALPRPTPWIVHLLAQPGVVYPGTLAQIGAVIDPNQHTALVSGQVNNADGRLRIGQFVTATIELPPPRDEVEVPTGALVEDGRESILFVQPDPRQALFVRRKVSVVRRFHDVVYLRTAPDRARDAEPIRPGERVVVSGSVLLKDALAELPVKP